MFRLLHPAILLTLWALLAGFPPTGVQGQVPEGQPYPPRLRDVIQRIVPTRTKPEAPLVNRSEADSDTPRRSVPARLASSSGANTYQVRPAPITTFQSERVASMPHRTPGQYHPPAAPQPAATADQPGTGSGTEPSPPVGAESGKTRLPIQAPLPPTPSGVETHQGLKVQVDGNANPQVGQSIEITMEVLNPGSLPSGPLAVRVAIPRNIKITGIDHDALLDRESRSVLFLVDPIPAKHKQPILLRAAAVRSGQSRFEIQLLDVENAQAGTAPLCTETWNLFAIDPTDTTPLEPLPRKSR